MNDIENFKPVDGNTEALRNLEQKNTGIIIEELNTGSLFTNLSQEDLRLVDSALNLIGFHLELNDFVSNFEFDTTNENKKKDIYDLSQNIKYASNLEDKKKKAKELAKIISQLYN